MCSWQHFNITKGNNMVQSLCALHVCGQHAMHVKILSYSGGAKSNVQNGSGTEMRVQQARCTHTAWGQISPSGRVTHGDAN